MFNYETVGTAQINGEYGVVGKLDETIYSTTFPVATADQVKIGKAKIFSTIDLAGAKFYDCEIIKVSPNKQSQNLTIRITDENLLESAGGIVQGMSGSPIVQNDKIVGVLTHSFVNNPKLGFGVLPEKII